MNSEEVSIDLLFNDLSLGLVMIDPDDLITIGEVLEKVEKLNEAFTARGPVEARLVLDGIRLALEAMILEKVTNKDKVLDIISLGMNLLQAIIKSMDQGIPFTGQLTDFTSGLEAEAGVTLGSPSIPDKAGETVQKITAVEKAPAGESTVDPEVDQDLFFGFVNEAMEHIESIEINVISLEQDPTNQETIASIFRPFHTIKGVSAFLNMRQIHNLTHEVESLLDEARQERLLVGPALIDVVLDAVDILKRMITDVKATLETGRQPETDYDVPHFLERLLEVKQGGYPEAPEPSVSEFGGRRLGEILIEQGLVEEEELEEILSAQEEGRLRRLGEIAVERGIICPEDLEEALSFQMRESGKKLGQILVETGKAEPAEILRAIKDQEALRDRKLGEMLILDKQAGAREVTEALREQKKTSAAAGPTAGRTVKVDTTKLDYLVDMVGELVIAQSLISSNDNVLKLRDQKLVKDLGHMARITSDLQRTAMSMRMVPIRQTFQKMIRLVRDLARKSGKDIDLKMLGEETEIDRNMVEAIYDPLVHMVRNSVDHGIENPKAREKAGKRTEGLIILRAYHQGGNVVIEIEDDGQGLNREKILKKAAASGLVEPDESISDSAVFSLIFQPGFSTADKVTDVSGRGVGMDVVKKSMEKLRGKIEVYSTEGKSSKIVIRLPLTLAIIDGMIVRVGDNRYILPTVSIHESFRPGPDDYHTVKGRGEMIKVRQNLFTIDQVEFHSWN